MIKLIFAKKTVMICERRKPFILSFLTVLSMLGGLLGIVIGVISIVDVNLLDIVNKIPGYSSIKSLTIGASSIYPHLKVVLYFVSFIGALFMFRCRKYGFYLYAVAQLVLLVLPYLTWNKSAVLTFFTDLPDFIFTGAFIFAYVIYLSEMKNDQSSVEANGNEK